MSRFFRGSDTSSADTSSEDDTEDNDHTEETFGSSQDTVSLDPVHRDVPNTADSGREWLLMSLLEERCLNQVRDEDRRSERPRGETANRIEARRRYQALCARLEPLNLVASGLEHDAWATTRQLVRDRLDSVQLNGDLDRQPLQRRDATQLALQTPGLRRLLTDGDLPRHPGMPFAPIPGIPRSIFDSFDHPHALTLPPRFHMDFDHFGVLGRGGYGQVFQVRHKLDQRLYAVKKIPIRPAMVARVQAEGESAINEILTEVRSLSNLEHPNVVRYFSSWIEWSTGDGFSSSFSERMSSNLDDSGRVVLGAEDASSLGFNHLGRVQTQSDGITEDIGISFESRSRQSIEPSFTGSRSGDASHTEAAGALVSGSGPILALHMQMDVYPMTLADFIAPKQTGDVTPLAHCFHLGPSVGIILAILDGVEYIHSRNVVHRDLKPANIFVRHENLPKASGCVDLASCAACQMAQTIQPAKLNVRIGDFGLVHNITQTKETDRPSSSSTSAVGTEIYRPLPTKRSNNETSNISTRLDIFAVGIIACELVCKFDTQMERRQTLHELRQGRFPERFAPKCARKHSSKLQECIRAMLSEGALPVESLKERLNALLTESRKPESEKAIFRRQSA